MNNPQQPGKYDAVLGGNSPSLEGAAVLGGIEGVKLRLRNPDSKVRIAALEQALNYGEQGLDLVIAGLKNESWDVQNTAYLILNSRTEPRIKQILQDPDKLGFKLEQIEVVTVDKFGEIIQRQPRVARYFLEDLGNGVNLEMAAIPGGTFLMGSPENEAGRRYDESPQHQVTVQPFYMGKYTVTQEQWEILAILPKINIDLNPKPSYFTANITRPVESVSWLDAQEFCARLSKITNKKYCLPTEAEWEYACRSGTTTPFYFGETITRDLVNYNSIGILPLNSEKLLATTEVGTFPPNAFGLYDMHGNVSEWCLDDWHGNYKNAPNDNRPWISQVSYGKILRGGAWSGNPENCRSAYDCRSACRWVHGVDIRGNYLGFRVVCSGAART